MRLWTLHPQYLDRQGLLAVWREGLLAQAVLSGKTRGYRHHPQLIRFRNQRSPQAAIASYLEAVFKESVQRGYKFDQDLIQIKKMRECIPETRGQLEFEWTHLMKKLKQRSPESFKRLKDVSTPLHHPLFRIIPGGVREWEKRQDA